MIASVHVADVGARTALRLLRRAPSAPGLRQANVAKLNEKEQLLVADLQLRLLLTMGRMAEARDGLTPRLKPLLLRALPSSVRRGE